MSHRFNFEVVPLAEVAEESAVDRRKDAPVVLVVDDERLIVDSLAVILARAGMWVMKAYDGTTALEAALKTPPNLLLTDVAMPGMNGVDLGMAVARALPECRVLLFSAHACLLDLTRAQAAGFDFMVLAKPLHPAELLRQVSAALEAPVATPVRERTPTESHPLPFWTIPQPGGRTGSATKANAAGKLAAVIQAALSHHLRNAANAGDVVERIGIEQHHVGAFASLDGA
jgi:CheY-like chemotaxis protein